MEKIKGITTEVGLLKGRDTIFLTKINFDGETKVTLTGKLNLADGDRNFEVTFEGVVYFSAIELDFDERGPIESLGTIENSEKVRAFRNRDRSRKMNDLHRHYYIRTYDTVFEIVSSKLTTRHLTELYFR